MEISKGMIGVATAVIGFVGGAAFKNTVDAYFGYQKLTLDQHKQLFDILKFHSEIRKSDKSGLATKYIIVMGQTNVLPADVANKIAELLAEDTPGAEAKAAVAAVVKPPDPMPAGPNSAPTGRMFVQASADAQRSLYESLRQSVTKQFPGVSVPALEIRGDYTGATELRYFFPDDEALASQVLKQLRAALGSVRCTRIRGYEKKGVRSGLLELWIGPGAATGADAATTTCAS